MRINHFQPWLQLRRDAFSSCYNEYALSRIEEDKHCLPRTLVPNGASPSEML